MANMSGSSLKCLFQASDESCKTILYIIAPIQMTIIIVAIILNLTIVITFSARRAVRKKISNILLFNQAVSDLFNVVVYGLSTVTNMLSTIVKGSAPRATLETAGVSISITFFSSLLLFTIIAFERFLSIQLPLWHRVNVRKKHIWIAIVLAWCFAIGFSLCIRLLFFHSPFVNRLLVMTQKVSKTLFAVVITVLFIATFLKVLYSTRSSPKESTSIISNSYFKRQLRVTGIFFVMFMAFAVVFVPLTVILNLNRASHLLIRIFFTILMLTSVINPMLTLYFKNEFRKTCRCCQQHIRIADIELRSMQTQS